MKKLLCMFYIACISLQGNTHEKPIPVPEALDGLKHLGIDGEQVQNMCYIVKKVSEINHGVYDNTTKQKIGKYYFQDNQYSVVQLANLEKEKHTWPKHVQQEFQHLLEQVKTDLMTISEPFIEQGRSVKAITLQFLHHWAKMHHRENSFVLKWSNQKDGHEIIAFQKEVTSFQDLHAFCTDLVSFISDLIKSCPRAWEQFKSMKKK